MSVARIGAGVFGVEAAFSAFLLAGRRERRVFNPVRRRPADH
jgi:hypothetical protein